MNTKIQVPMGMKDWKENEINNLLTLEKDWLQFLAKEGFSEIRTPMLESVDLFVRSVGEFSDIVSKEMFVVDDLVLRPEGTAPIMRSYLEDAQSGPRYFSYFAPFFRKERPQKGRFRQFYQYGCEIIGEDAPQSEVVVLKALNDFYNSKNVKFRFEVNYIPEESGLKRYEQELFQFYTKNKSQLSESSQKRLSNGTVLRILDSKEDANLNSTAPSILDFLSFEEKTKFDRTLEILSLLGVNFSINTRLVRGLDYYEGLVFEVVDESNTLGAQNALGGGGRYNKLSIQLGSKEKIFAFGFAGGVERLLYQLEPIDNNQKLRVSLISTENILPQLSVLKNRMQKEVPDVLVDINYDTRLSFKKMFKRADKLNSDYVIILGKNELEQNKFLVKALDTGSQKEFLGSVDDISLVSILNAFKE